MSAKLTILVILLVVFAVFYLAAYRRMAAGRDLDWERRWRQLPRGDRKRISAAVRRGETLVDPWEAGLAAGSARFQRQLVWHPTAGAWTMLAIFLAISVAVVLDGNLALLPLGLAGLAFAFWRLSRAVAVTRNLARAETLNRAGPRA
jgi:hypothetical protein